jgi:hypothetical protein
MLELLHTGAFDEEMNRFRCVCFAGQYPSAVAKDEFDDRSIRSRPRSALSRFSLLRRPWLAPPSFCVSRRGP